jgi:hypothetical protein
LFAVSPTPLAPDLARLALIWGITSAGNVQGEGRQARRRVVAAAASYKAPPAEEQEAEGSLAVQPPERDGLNQNAPGVLVHNGRLTNCYGEMVDIFLSIKKHVVTRNNLQADADRRRDWSWLAGRLHGLRTDVDDMLSRYDALSDEVATLRTRIRADGGCPVEPPPILAFHPSSLTSRK